MVLGLSDDGQWVFTDQSDAGSPIEGITVIERASSPTPDVLMPPPLPNHLLVAQRQKLDGQEKAPDGFRKAIFPVDDDCDVTLIFPKGMTSEQLDDLDSYLSIFLGKEKKKAEPE